MCSRWHWAITYVQQQALGSHACAAAGAGQQRMCSSRRWPSVCGLQQHLQHTHTTYAHAHAHAHTLAARVALGQAAGHASPFAQVACAPPCLGAFNSTRPAPRNLRHMLLLQEHCRVQALLWPERHSPPVATACCQPRNARIWWCRYNLLEWLMPVKNTVSFLSKVWGGSLVCGTGCSSALRWRVGSSCFLKHWLWPRLCGLRHTCIPSLSKVQTHTKTHTPACTHSHAHR